MSFLTTRGLFLFADDLTETTHEAQDLFSEERLEATLQSCAAQPLRSLVGSVTEEEGNFVAGTLRPTTSRS